MSMLERLYRDQRGINLLVTVSFMVILLALTGLATDVACAWVAREEMQTAVDAAALAGTFGGENGGGAERWVKLSVQYGSCECCGKVCNCCCSWDAPEYITGREIDLLDKGHWRRGTCSSLLGVEDRWIQFAPDTYSTVDFFLRKNWPDILSEQNGGGMVGNPQIIGHGEGSPYYPSVTVSATGKYKPCFLPVVGISSIDILGQGQFGVFFSLIKDGWEYGINEAPKAYF